MERTHLFAMSAQDYFNWQHPAPDFSGEPDPDNRYFHAEEHPETGSPDEAGPAPGDETLVCEPF
ncbi:MAG: hypothetical protein SFV22_06660 [Saprospiraceae bacterium]|nr:hypothetical protein [Saprospiraceae bacterium]